MAKKHKYRCGRPDYKEAVHSRLCCWRRAKLARLSEAQGNRCCYCSGETFLLWPGESLPKGMSWDSRATLEHLTPQSKAKQTNRDSNLVMACAQCNVLRGCKPPIAFYEKLRREIVPDKPAAPALVSVEQLEKQLIRQGKTLALCLITAQLWPEDLAYWADNWKPPGHNKKNRTPKRRKKINKIKRAMLADPRRLAA